MILSLAHQIKNVRSQILSLGVGLFGTCAFLGALLWEALGAKPCALCLLERKLFLCAGLVSLLSLFFKNLTKQRFFAITGGIWSASFLVCARHMGIQLQWLDLPTSCKAVLPSTGSIETLEIFLSQKPQTSCDSIEFYFLGLPPTFYLLLVSLFFSVLCFWAFLRKEPLKKV